MHISQRECRDVVGRLGEMKRLKVILLSCLFDRKYIKVMKKI